MVLPKKRVSPPPDHGGARQESAESGKVKGNNGDGYVWNQVHRVVLNICFSKSLPHYTQPARQKLEKFVLPRGDIRLVQASFGLNPVLLAEILLRYLDKHLGVYEVSAGLRHTQLMRCRLPLESLAFAGRAALAVVKHRIVSAEQWVLSSE